VSFGAISRHPGAHQHGASQDRGPLEKKFFIGKIAGAGYPSQQGIDRDLLKNESPEVPSIVDVVGIPRAKMVVGTPMHRVVEIKRSRIEGQFFQQFRIKPRLLQQVGIGLPENLQCPLDQGVVGPWATPT
jgi:hypothetical protein